MVIRETRRVEVEKKERK